MMTELLRQANREPLVVSSNMDAVTLTFRLPPRDGAVNEGVNEGVSEGVTALLEYIQRQPGMRAPALATLLNTSPKNIERWIKQLRNAGLIEFVGPSKTGGYHSMNQLPGKPK